MTAHGAKQSALILSAKVGFLAPSSRKRKFRFRPLSRLLAPRCYATARLGTSPNLSVQDETYCSVEALPVENGEFAAGGRAGTACSSAVAPLARPAMVRKHAAIEAIPNSTAPSPRPARTPSAP